MTPSQTQSVYDFTLTSIAGESQPLSQYEGQVLLMVNVASECGFTRQYKGLQQLHEGYADKGLVVMGIPANEFGRQEPGTDEEIQAFCSARFNVTFPMFSKIVVKGDKQHPLYAYLTSLKGDVSWNFNKFLIGRGGQVIERFDSRAEPDGPELMKAIESALGT